MGRGFKKRKHAKKGQQNAKRPDRRSEPYPELIKSNDAFLRYYKHTGFCTETEFEEFLKFLREPLPTTFRITGYKAESQRLLDLIKSEFYNTYVVTSESQANIEDEAVKKPFCLPWYPNEMGWQLELSRKDIRRSERYYKLHNFLIAETNAGSISRQEAVSMIPPLVLDVQSHHKVLDMCAAPGSKTTQLIEALHGNEHETIPSGFVVANDVDNTRCYMLVHQTKRLNSPNFIVINHDSSILPQCILSNGKQMKYDRVLCDVPCSGDGTLRKNPDIWPRWKPEHGLNLHGIQFRIAKRGLELLEIGGRLVYSTCSLNPIENEAVIHRLLKEANGAIELIDVKESLPGLKYMPGLTHWELSARDCTVYYKSFEEVPVEYHTSIRPQMFPPAKEDASKYGLDKCIRILPHYQNSGAFFVAVFVKTRNLPWTKEEKVVQPSEVATEPSAKADEGEGSAKADDDGKTAGPWGPQRKKRRIQGYKEDPYVFFTEEEPIWASIEKFYDIDITKVGEFKPSYLLSRTATGKKKNIYFCSGSVKELVQNNERNLKIINTGVKVFARCDNRNMLCDFRLANEGLTSISSIIGDQRRVEINRDDLIVLLNTTVPTESPKITTLSADIQAKVANLSAGSCVFIHKAENFTLHLVGWRGTTTLRAYTDLNDSIHMLRMLGADVSKFDVNKFNKKENAPTETETASAETETASADNENASVDNEKQPGDNENLPINSEKLQNENGTVDNEDVQMAE